MHVRNIRVAWSLSHLKRRNSRKPAASRSTMKNKNKTVILKTHTCRSGSHKKTTFTAIRVGRIVFVYQDEYIGQPSVNTASCNHFRSGSLSRFEDNFLLLV